jgi:hypothetical protein
LTKFGADAGNADAAIETIAAPMGRHGRDLDGRQDIADNGVDYMRSILAESCQIRLRATSSRKSHLTSQETLTTK